MLQPLSPADLSGLSTFAIAGLLGVVLTFLVSHLVRRLPGATRIL